MNNQIEKAFMQKYIKEHPELTKKQIKIFKNLYCKLTININKLFENPVMKDYNKKEFKRYVKSIKKMIKKKEILLKIKSVDYKKREIIYEKIKSDFVSFDITFKTNKDKP